MKYISLGKIEIKFVIIILILIIINIPITLYDKYNNDDLSNNSRIMTATVKHIGLSLCFIPYLILRKINKKGAKKHSSLKIKFLLIVLISFLYLIHDFAFMFSNRYIQINRDENKNITDLHLEGNYYFFFIVLIIFSFIFKNKYYKHQYISMFIIIALGIVRYIAKLNSYMNNKTTSIKLIIGEICFHIIRYITNALYLSLTKLLIEYYFVTPYKTSFYIGIINVSLNLSLYFLFTKIPFENKNWLCSIEYNNKYYIDNIYSFFEQTSNKKILFLLL